MSGRGFLIVARDVVAGTTPFHWRAAAIDAYYALFLECRDALLRWGLVLPRRENVHSWVRLRYTYTAAPDLKELGYTLDDLVQLRNSASYDMNHLAVFATRTAAQKAIQDAEDALALLDSIEFDPIRQAAARAAIRP